MQGNFSCWDMGMSRPEMLEKNVFTETGTSINPHGIQEGAVCGFEVTGPPVAYQEFLGGLIDLSSG